MSESAKSVLYFGMYMIILVALLILVPNVLLAFGAMPINLVVLKIGQNS